MQNSSAYPIIKCTKALVHKLSSVITYLRV